MAEQKNDIFNLAFELVNYTDKHVFLTGKAGTGKTTFLKYIRQHTHKNVAVVAPTGVAAINAGGTTLHSLLQLPFGVYVPEGFRPTHIETREEIHDRQSLQRRLRFSPNKRKVIQALELLIIDEISMVRADLLDMVDTVLRHVRKRPQAPFGGIQVLYIGDMFQLPPVAKDTDRDILNQYYRSPFFFDARVIQEAPPHYVELTHVYRQRDETFVEVLNQVRNNRLTEEGLALLRSRYQPGFEPTKAENYITLTTHNYMADRINLRELDALPSRYYSFEAKIEDDFPEYMYPVDKELRLKQGAQVMFIKNDTENPQRYFNGKIGVITEIENDKVVVKCPGDLLPITVRLETWENIRYSYDQQTRTVQEEVLGKFSQFPLRLAWAITIHKSQGLTFEKAIIDAGKAFEAGQVYVALSRCTSLDGMVLLSPIHPGLVMIHERISQFGRKERRIEELLQAKEQAMQRYLRDRLREVFHFSEARLKVIQMLQAFQGFRDIFNSRAGEWLDTLQQLVDHLHTHVQPLQVPLAQKLEAAINLEEDASLQQFFKQHVPAIYAMVQEKIWPHWRRLPGMQTGHSRREAEGFFTLTEELNDWWKERILRLERLKDGFKADHFFSTRTAIVAADPPIPAAADYDGRNEKGHGKKEKKQQPPRGSSVLQTLEVWEQHRNIAAVAETRNLARSTIEGHLAQAIAMGKLRAEVFMDTAKMQRILALLPEESLGVSITPIKEQLGDEVSYSEIRMVLAQKRYDAIREKEAAAS